MFKKMKKGFTLIELLVVIAIIGILATIVIINVASARGKANDAKALSDMSGVQKVAAMCQTVDGNIQSASGTVIVVGAAAVNLTATGNICSNSAAGGASGTWPSLGMKASNNATWTIGKGSVPTAGGFTIDAAAEATPGTAAAGDYKIACTATGCVKQQGAIYGTSSVTW